MWWFVGGLLVSVEDFVDEDFWGGRVECEWEWERGGEEEVG